eukprot:CAMPEP_0198700606 /NCGR_PEP_ID=MMETSP1468-20131203/372252_1 /TAXON_ID=1461545 /ORGANISM="Mantoniella sp, Strain CCMP1436" /LENGTH=61 /DNA_ID=CAMNT_0044458611 /DNA_START=168 /DNA_END=353 /DNA_ORIENTATION=+
MASVSGMCISGPVTWPSSKRRSVIFLSMQIDTSMLPSALIARSLIRVPFQWRTSAPVKSHT